MVNIDTVDCLPCFSDIELKDKFQLLKSVKLNQFSTIISVVISVCLLANLFAPGFSAAFKDKGGVSLDRYHTCGCNTERHNINTCCCARETDTCGSENLMKKYPEGMFSAFIQSLACKSLPDQFTPISYNVTIPEDGIASPSLSMLHYLKNHQEVFPASIKISPPDKPPRHLA